MKNKIENTLISYFKNFSNSNDAKSILTFMKYDLSQIKSVEAFHLKEVRRTVIIKITDVAGRVFLERVRIKTVNKLTDKTLGYNQISKKPVSYYANRWEMPKGVSETLKKFTGEVSDGKSKRKFMGEFEKKEQKAVINFFKKNKTLILSDILKGRGKNNIEWFLIEEIEDGKSTYHFMNINDILHRSLGDGKVEITKRGSIRIGNVTVQRMGGKFDPTKNYLQFKLKPLILIS